MNIQIPQYWPVSQHTDRLRQGSTFVAIKGSHRNGIDFIDQALQKGAATIVVDQDVTDVVRINIEAFGAQLLVVADARKALADLSAQAWGNPQHALKFVGTTGTKGKTTTTYLIRHMLAAAGYKTAMISGVKNYILEHEFQAELTTPHADYFYAFLATCVQAGVEYVAMEVSAQGLSLHRVANILFDGVIFTNLSQEHAEFYACMDDYFSAKKQLFSCVKKSAVMLINTNDIWSQQLKNAFPDAMTIGFSDASVDYLITNVHSDFSGLRYDLVAQDAVYEIKSPILFGFFNALNAADAFVMCLMLGLPVHLLLDALKTFRGVPGRMEGYSLPNGALGIVDYAHTPSSYEQVLSALRPLTQDLIVVFGAGGGKDPIKRPIMGRIAAEVADKVIVTSDNPRKEDPLSIIQQIVEGIPMEHHKKLYKEVDREIAIKKAYSLSTKGTIILVLGKGPDEYQIIGDQKIFFSDKQVVMNCC